MHQFKKGDKIKVVTVLHGKKEITINSIEKHAVITWLFCDDGNAYDADDVEKVNS
jgi:hypothetical protein